MISSKDKERRTRLNRERNARKHPATGRDRRPLLRWLCLLTASIALLVAGGYWWLTSQTIGKANPHTDNAKRDLPTDVPAVVRRLSQAELANNQEEIERELLLLIDLDSGNSKWLMQLCDFYFSQGRWSTATETFTAKVNRHFSPQEAYQLQGAMLNALINFGKPEEARLILNPILSRSATKAIEIAQMEARLLRLEGKSQEALDVLKNAGPESHENEHLHKLAGILEFDLGHYDRALSSLKQASRLNPYSESTQFKLAECARLLGDQQAEQQYRAKYTQLVAVHQEIATLKTHLEQSPTWTDAQALRLAALYESVGQLQQAAYCKQQVRGTLPPSGKVGP